MWHYQIWMDCMWWLDGQIVVAKRVMTRPYDKCSAIERVMTHEPSLCTNHARCCLYTALKGVVFDNDVKTFRPLCIPPSITCVHLCVLEGFGLCDVIIQDVKFYVLAELVQVQSSVDLSWISSIGLQCRCSSLCCCFCCCCYIGS